MSAASAERKTVPQIARRLGVTRQGVQRIADLLVGEGVATYEANPDHRSSPHLVLTERGRTALAALTKSAAGLHARIADNLAVDDLQQLHAGLRNLIAALRRAD
jgi:DNA-binding MarR family transcriptional regulator